MRERSGVHFVGGIVTDGLDWIFREQPILDFGVDAHLEIISSDDLVTGRNIGLQIKSGESYFRRPRRLRDGWTFSASNDHLAYWLGHTLPIVVVLVTPEKKAYWQVVSPATVTEKPNSFTLFIPESQPFDESARDRLSEIAGRSGGVLEALPRRYEQLPPDAARALRRAADLDRLGVARLADRLAEGSDLSQMTAASLLAAKPTWLTFSPAAEDLWMAVGVYAAAHGHRRQAAGAFEQAAAIGGPRSARAHAFAGLMLLYDGDRDQSPALLRQAREGGATLLADIGLTALSLPANDARAFEVPPSIRDATAAQIDAEPTVLNFLSEGAIRRGDLNNAVTYQEQALARHGDGMGGTRLALAQALFRRESASTQPSARENRRAVIHAQAAVEGRRRWRGPSAEALAVLLRIYIVTGEAKEAITAALPASQGGTATDYEAADPEVARHGALAAHLAGDAAALAFFLSSLPDDAQTRLVRAQTCDLDGLSRQELVAMWTRLVDEATDDEMTAKCVSRLAFLGVWPPQADDLDQRSIMQSADIAVLKAAHLARSGRQERGLAELRHLAHRDPSAAHALVLILEEDVSREAAIDESQRQVRVSQDPRLRLQLVGLLRAHGDYDRAAEIAERTIRDPSLANFLRLELCRWLIAEKQRTNDIAAAISVAREGLEITDDPQLAWVLVSSLLELGRLSEAREALARHRPQPVSDREVHLWVHLHLGQPLTANDAQTMLDLVDRRPAGRVRQGLITLLVRDVQLAAQEGTAAFPQPIVEQVEALAAELQTGDEHGIWQVQLSDDNTIRELLTRRQPDPAVLNRLIDGVRSGTVGLPELARETNQPYGAALLHRPAGVLFASDLTLGLRRVGEGAARSALEAGEAVIDMSSLHLLNLLEHEDQLTLRGAIRDLFIPVTTVNDAIRTSDAVRSTTVAFQHLSLKADGQIDRTTLSAVKRGWLREQAALLEEAIRGLQPRSIPQPSRAPADTIALGADLDVAMWCDDSYGRQQARGRGVSTFSLLDLLTVLWDRNNEIDVSRILRRLAAQYVVDLPLDADDAAAVAAETDWEVGPVHVLLSRPAWWKHCGQTWPDSWYTIAKAARLHSDTALTSMTKAALSGAIQDVTPGLRTRRYQELTVIALRACHAASKNVPHNFLVDLADSVGQDVAAAPTFLLRALIREFPPVWWSLSNMID
ncbi:DUF4365 domain-containing protein [Actinoplanes sp. NBRC 103695]|uniref:DUF4365 domain-containing protein n=1 Tax=Actinoplanes sp. NBRC 103695 TaxID=3032202 RepID=UPI00249FD347|nr:DUF4365 domain-containing protein [Actinoplanes sp. NBRC 103695]GLZ02395.1 hypothetical protein Acsp02_96460 [Actinoplanes sp. NBRC 103695]